jgi:hypothetical protein
MHIKDKSMLNAQIVELDDHIESLNELNEQN